MSPKPREWVYCLVCYSVYRIGGRLCKARSMIASPTDRYIRNNRLYIELGHKYTLFVPCVVCIAQNNNDEVLNMPKFNEQTYQILHDMDKTNPDTFPMFGGAVYVATIDDLVTYLPHVISYARHKGYDIIDNIQTFCHICLIDPMLVQAYIGTTFTNLIREVL